MDKVLIDKNLLVEIYYALCDADATFKLNEYMEWEQVYILNDDLKEKLKEAINKSEPC